LPQLLWTVFSVGLFTAICEFLWYVEWADPRLLPPPHVFLGDLTSQARFFNTAQR
jgi:NitT/TauT family transport system permease protein